MGDENDMVDSVMSELTKASYFLFCWCFVEESVVVVVAAVVGGREEVKGKSVEERRM